MREDHGGAHGLAGRQDRGLQQRLEPAGGALNLANGLVCHQTAILVVGLAMSGCRDANSRDQVREFGRPRDRAHVSCSLEDGELGAGNAIEVAARERWRNGPVEILGRR